MGTRSLSKGINTRCFVAIIVYFISAGHAEAQGFAWFSCENRGQPLAIADAIIALNPDLVVTQGDTPYANHGRINVWGYIAESVQFDSVASGTKDRDFNAHYNQMMSNPDWQTLVAGAYDIYSQFDDHEWGGDNWAHNLTTANSQISINATTQADVNFHWRQGRTAWQTWADAYSRNANATRDITVNTEIPSGALQGNGTPVPADYPVTYFRKTYGEVEFIFIDTISYRDYSSSSPGSLTATMLGAQQKAWLINRINASNAKFVVVSSTKKLGTTGTTDGWSNYRSERNQILAAITRTGVVWISGDHHWPAVIRNNDGDASKYTNIVASPAGVNWSGSLPQNNNSGTLIWASDGIPSGTNITATDMFGYGYVQNDQLHIQIRSFDQTIYYHGYMTPDSNEITTVFARPSLPLVNDDDNDGVTNGNDNCRYVPNGPLLTDPDDNGIPQRNTDADAFGDACDTDDDNDGLLDVAELAAGTDRLLADTDGDGINDGRELPDGTDPLDDTSFYAVANGDINNDGPVDLRDLLLATKILSNQYTPNASEQARWDVAPLVGGIPRPDGNNNLGDYVVLLRKIIGAVSF
jgi:hypothetical protein